MPLQPDDDPIVLILIEAYKRGLAIQQNSQPASGESATPFNVKSPQRKDDFTGTATTDDCRNCTFTEGHDDDERTKPV